MRKIQGVFIVLLSLNSLLFAQQNSGSLLNYLWPTNASKYLTSSFGEYRARRYHTGIDVKTWGKTGYKVFAIRSGYVLRVGVSPNGYGKVVYIKLDTGETAVFAHLSKFAPRIQKLVEAEQQRLGKYRINLYLKPGQVPVKQGEVIAYTGQTGIGAPHLHFEIRNSKNLPMNPLSKKYQIPDRVKPIVRRVSFSPLDATSEVNGDFEPVIVTPKWVRSGEYVISEPISFWGKLGLAVRCFDKGVNSFSGYGVYALKLFVDDVLRFEYSYDTLSFQKNRMIELERDYRLSRRRQGRFYKLYKDKFNTRSDYRPNKTWAGVIKSAELSGQPSLQSKSSAAPAEKIDFQTGSLFPGLHEFRIELSDYSGNVSTIHGRLQVGAAFDINPVIVEDDGGQLSLHEVVTFDLKNVDTLEAFVLNGKKWQPIPLKWSESNTLEEKGGEGTLDDTDNTPGKLLLKNPPGNPLILKIIARDEFNVESYPFFFIDPGTHQTDQAPELTVEYDYYDDYLRLEITSKNTLGRIPEVSLYPEKPRPEPVSIHQTDLKKYIGRIELNKLSGSFHLLKITAETLSGKSYSTFEQFEARAIKPRTSNQIISGDEKFWVDFWSGSLYRPLYTRIVVDSTRWLKKYDFVSPIYEVEPKDALLNQGAFVHMKYPQSAKNPEQIGVYYNDARKGWIFIDNNIDVTAGSISAKILSFEEFALIRDSQPPEITRIRPRNNVHLKNKTPRISFSIQDRLSGIKSEEEIVVQLNGQFLIAEYDPERKRVFYDIKRPLAKGRYELTISAQDNAKNSATRTSVFWID